MSHKVIARTEGKGIPLAVGRLFIPPLGTRIRLTKAWHFGLHNEYRNESMFERMGIPRPTHRDGWPNASVRIPCQLPEGTELVIDRIYIRKGGRAFDSVTFFAPGLPPASRHTTIRSKTVRFWVKLADVNIIHCEVVSWATPGSGEA